MSVLLTVCHIEGCRGKQEICEHAEKDNIGILVEIIRSVELREDFTINFWKVVRSTTFDGDGKYIEMSDIPGFLIPIDNP